MKTPQFITREIIAQIYKKPTATAHKGMLGHALIIGGSYGKIGAVCLSAKAALKAFFEQTFRYGFAMTNEARGFPKPLLTGKSARSIVTMGMPAFIYRWWFGAYAMRALETSLLGLAGIRPQRRTIIGGLGALTKEKAAAHLKAVEELGRRGV